MSRQMQQDISLLLSAHATASRPERCLLAPLPCAPRVCTWIHVVAAHDSLVIWHHIIRATGHSGAGYAVSSLSYLAYGNRAIHPPDYRQGMNGPISFPIVCRSDRPEGYFYSS